MARIFFAIILAIEIFASMNRGGGPLLSYLFLTGVTFLLVTIWVFFYKKHGPLRITRNALLFYSLFFLFFLFSFLFSQTPGFGLAEFLLFANTGILFLIISSSEISEADERDLSIFSIALIGLALIDTLIGYFLYTATSFPRFAGTFLDLREPYISFGNDFADFLLLILPLAVWQLLKNHRRKTSTILLTIICAILFSGFILSFSRAAWLSAVIVLLAAAIWIGLRRGKKFDIPVKKILLRIISVAVLAILLVSALQYTRSQRFETISIFRKATFTADEGAASASERIQFWKGALHLIKEKPFFGSGVLSFKYLYPRYQTTFGTNWDHPHNILLKIAVENGLVAAGLFLLFLVAIAVSVLRFLWKNPRHPVLFFSIGALAAFGHNLLDYNFIVSNFTLFMLFLGIGVSSISKLQTKEPALLKRGIFVVSLCLILLGIYEGFGNVDFRRGRIALAENDLDVAIVSLENSQRLLFQRDLTNYLAIAYRKKYEVTKDEQWKNKEKALLSRALDSTIDAAVVSRLGEIFLEEKNLTKAEGLFRKALATDPMNRLKYYYELIDVWQKQNKPIDLNTKAFLKKLLKEYMEALRSNRHIMILTDNSKYAELLYEFLDMPIERLKIKKIWFEEYMKFGLRYALPKVISPAL